MNLLTKWLNTISLLFRKKNQHAFGKYCLSNKCKVCKTPWPNKKQKTFTEEYLESIKYYDNYRKVLFPSNKEDGLEEVGGVFNGGYLILPEGMTGKEILDIAEKLKPKYTKLVRGNIEEESKRIAKLQGFNEEK